MLQTLFVDYYVPAGSVPGVLVVVFVVVYQSIKDL